MYTHIELFYLLAMGFFAYYVGELLASGVVTIITTSLMFAIFGWYNLSQ